MMHKIKSGVPRVIGIVTAILALVFTGSSGVIYAGTFKNFSPIVEEGEKALELRYSQVGATQAMNIAAEWHFDEKWRTEIVIKQSNGATEGYELEFVRSLTGGEDSASTSAVAMGIEMPAESGNPNAMGLGFYFKQGFGQKGSGENPYARNLLVNVKLESQFGTGAASGTEIKYGAQHYWKMGPEGLQVGLGAFGEIEPQEHRAGLMVAGDIELGDSALEYEVGYLAGVTPAAEESAVLFNLEFMF